MNIDKVWILIITLTIMACFKSSPKYISMLNQKDEFIWIGVHNDTVYTLAIHGQEDKWFDGSLVIGSNDTLHLRGFEKGNNHPTSFKKDMADSLSAGSIFIWIRGMVSDTVEIINRNDDRSILPPSLILLKRKLNIN